MILTLIIILSILILAVIKRKYIISLYNTIKNAKNGNSENQFIIGNFYFNSFLGSLLKKNGLKWLESSAQQGYIPALEKLGYIYLHGDREEVDHHKSVSYFERASSLGSNLAMYQLGVLYGYEESPLHDYSKSFSWLYKAASLGNSTAQYMLALMYKDGIGIDKNIVSACAWFMVAAGKGEQTTDMEELKSVMLPEELKQAEDMSKILKNIA